MPRQLLCEDRGAEEGAVRPTSRRGRPFKVQRSVKVPHGESPQLRKLAARAHVDQVQENHAGSRYHDRVAAATGTNSNRYEPVRLFILLPGRSDSVAKHRGALQLIRARGIVVVTSLL